MSLKFITMKVCVHEHLYSPLDKHMKYQTFTGHVTSTWSIAYMSLTPKFAPALETQ